MGQDGEVEGCFHETMKIKTPVEKVVRTSDTQELERAMQIRAGANNRPQSSKLSVGKWQPRDQIYSSTCLPEPAEKSTSIYVSRRSRLFMHLHHQPGTPKASAFATLAESDEGLARSTQPFRAVALSQGCVLESSGSCMEIRCRKYTQNN